MNRIAALVVCLTCALVACGEDKSVQKPNNDVHTLDTGDAGDSTLADVPTADALAPDALEVGVDAMDSDAGSDAGELLVDQCVDPNGRAATDPESLTGLALIHLLGCVSSGDDLQSCAEMRMRRIEETEGCKSCFAEYAVCLWRTDRDCARTCEDSPDGWRCDRCQWESGCWERGRECAGRPVIPDRRCQLGSIAEATWDRFREGMECLQSEGDVEGCLDAWFSGSGCNECQAIVYDDLWDCVRDDGPCSGEEFDSPECGECMAPHEEPFEQCIGYGMRYPDF